ncbi:MAG: glycosyltransferase family 2 protein [Vicinamibacterales bacterium]
MKLSVSLTAYGRTHLLARTLESLARQTRPPDELIVSDDCSPEDPTVIAETFRPRFARFRYNRNTRNLSMPANLNLAVGMAGGEYVANLHDADVFHPRLLEKWEQALDRHPRAGFVFCGIEGWHRFTGRRGGVILHDIAPVTDGRAFFEKHFLHRFRSIVWGTVMARAEAYKELLPFDPAYGYISDVDMWMRMCLRWDVAYVREPLIRLDMTPTPWRAFRWDRLELMRRMQRDNIRRFYGDDPVRLSREMKRHVRAVRREYMWRAFNRLRRGDWRSFKQGIGLCRLATAARIDSPGEAAAPAGSGERSDP